MFKRKVPGLGVSPAKTPRNAFDLSERHLYTQPCGMLLPVFVKDLNPDERIEIDIASQIQAQTLKGRAFVGMQQQFAAYFVPYRYLYSYWDSLITGVSGNNSLHSSALNPLFTASKLKAPTFRPFSEDLLSPGNQGSDYMGYPIYLGYTRICDMLGYGFVYDSELAKASPSRPKFEANAFRWLAYQKIYQDHFLDDRFEQRHVDSYNVDSCFDYKSGSCAVTNFECFSPRYAKYNKDFLSNIMPSPLFVQGVQNVIQPFVGLTPTVAIMILVLVLVQALLFLRHRFVIFLRWIRWHRFPVVLQRLIARKCWHIMVCMLMVMLRFLILLVVFLVI